MVDILMGNISEIMGILGFLISSALAALKFKEYYDTRANIDVKWRKIAPHQFRNSTKEEREGFYGDGAIEDGGKIPEKVFNLDLEFEIINSGDKERGINNIQVLWKEPRFRECHYHNMVHNVSDLFLENENFIISGNSVIKKRVYLETCAPLAIALDRRKAKYKRDWEQRKGKYDLGTHANHWFEYLPRKVVLEIVVEDIKNNKIRRQVDLHLS